MYLQNLKIKNGGALRNQTTSSDPKAIITFNISANNIIIEDGGRIEGNVFINASNLTVLTGGLINSTGTGYAGGLTDNDGNGPGRGDGVTSGECGGGGAGYGGLGGDGSCTNTVGGSGYGSITFPFDLGSGGAGGNFIGAGGAGGGSVFINATNMLNVSGIIIANGTDGQTADDGGGGGSGGSIYLIAANFTGNGSVIANGGIGGTNTVFGGNGGGGAGGRIAVYYTEGTFNGKIQAFGRAAGGSGARAGGAGTFFIKPH